MTRHSKINHEVAVQLTTAKGMVFFGTAQAIALHTADGIIEVTAQGESYLSLIGVAELTVRTSDGSRAFRLENATASIKPGRLTVLAETIREIEPAGC